MVRSSAGGTSIATKRLAGLQVILAALVNDSKDPIQGRVRAGNNRVNLVQLQGRLVIGVVYANHKSGS